MSVHRRGQILQSPSMEEKEARLKLGHECERKGKNLQMDYEVFIKMNLGKIKNAFIIISNELCICYYRSYILSGLNCVFIIIRNLFIIL